MFLDRLGNEPLAQRVVEKAQALFSWQTMPAGSSKPSPKVETYGIVEDKRMSSTFMLGVIAQRLAEKAGMEAKLPSGAPEFLAAVQDGLAAGFGWLKAEADASMQRDVFNFLHARVFLRVCWSCSCSLLP